MELLGVPRGLSVALSVMSSSQAQKSAGRVELRNLRQDFQVGQTQTVCSKFKFPVLLGILNGLNVYRGNKKPKIKGIMQSRGVEEWT